MAKLISECPVCGNDLNITKLQCPCCGMELSNSFEISPFDKLDNDQYLFLTTFLKHRGNLKLLQEELNITYPYAKKKLTELLSALNLTQENDETFIKEDVNMQIQFESKESNRAGDIVRRKLMENGGRAIVTSISGNRYGIKADTDGQHILCNELPPIYTYDVFDVIVDLLKTQPNYRADKGSARGHRLGEAGCEENTVAGAILKNYFGKSVGESGVDPVFVLAAVLEWAGIAHNCRGYLELTAAYSEGV